MTSSVLKPAAELARTNTSRFPNESAEYRRARQALLAEEIELRRHIERVAELRRALPPGGEVTTAYEFTGEAGPASLGDLFGKFNICAHKSDNELFSTEPGEVIICTNEARVNECGQLLKNKVATLVGVGVVYFFEMI